MKRFYFTGHRTFENRGCEAIVRSTAMMLNEVAGPCEILVPSDDIARDSRQWPDADRFGVRFVKAYVPAHTRFWTHLQRIPLGVLKRSGWPFPFPRWLNEQIGGVDAVIAVGGDNYSLDYRLPSLTMGIDRLAMDMGRPMFLWGASVGPFEAEPQFVPVIRDHLARMSNIAVREQVSYDYLTRTLGLGNVSLMADPAFTLVLEPVDTAPFWPTSGGAGVLGLNISPLIERYRREGQDLRQETMRFIRFAVAQGFGVLLIPHVDPVGAGPESGDAAYMATMLGDLGDLGKAVTIMPSTFNAAQIKGVIAKLRFFIGARTHATIAGLSSGVPTISISYSVKARGINRDLFGDIPVVLDTPMLSLQTLTEKLELLLKEEGRIRDILAENIPQWRARARDAASKLAEAC
ncbi:polysaccharide pyruvyl transferase family protein [Sphingopyxis sp. 550A]